MHPDPTPEPPPVPTVVVRNLSKSFPGVKALSEIDFDVNAGEVHCLIGENGAGKSTLVKILAGVYAPDAGEIDLNGTAAAFGSPLEAQDAGIACIFQEMNVVDGLSAAENIVLGDEPSRFGLFDKKRACSAARALLDEIGFLELDETRLCKSLSPAEKQAVMIAKALRQNAQIIIMDEPTSPLEEVEVRKLFDVVSRLKSSGKGIVYVSHKMREIDELGDRITVFKDGAKVATLSRGQASSEDLVRLMVGRQLDEMFPPKDRAPGEKILSVTGLTGPAISHVSFELRRGEILGVAGLVGSGRTELLRSIFGADPVWQGDVVVDGRRLQQNSISAAITAGIALVPEERRSQGIVPILSVLENASLVWDQFPQHRSNSKTQSDAVRDTTRLLNVKTPSLGQRIDKLSGGNQQKVVLSKWLLARTNVMLLDEPTRGIDVGAKREIYQIIDALAKEGLAVMLVSSEMPELLGLADRIVVMNSGAIVGELPGTATEEEIIALSMLHAASDADGRADQQ
ncbi:MAG: sugar ABC transporter ATP-binding protein [Pseudomonadota bacterium]